MDELMERAGELEKRLLRIGERVPVSCPDGIKGCLVNHYRIETDPTCKQAAAEIRSLRERLADAEETLTVAYLAGKRSGAEKERAGIVAMVRQSQTHYENVGRPDEAMALECTADAIEAQQDKTT